VHYDLTLNDIGLNKLPTSLYRLSSSWLVECIAHILVIPSIHHHHRLFQTRGP